MYPADLPTIRNAVTGAPSSERDAADGDTCNIHLSETPPPSAFPRVRGYIIESFVGSGGMGVVYKARHIDLQRKVALKMLHESAAGDRESHERFQSEAEAVARVQHPNIIQVFEIGSISGQSGDSKPRPFLSLEFMDGGSLTRFTESPQSPTFTARLVEKLARAAHAAHVLGVVHRDLKPANVLFTKGGEPKIADFGVAKLSGEENRGLTQAGMTVGTPEYMAPEQASGEDSGASADIYSLGVILYQLLTARLPFHGSNPMDTMYLVRNEEPISPRRFQPHLPRDLETICLKCLSKKPARRYATAQDLADDLVRWSEGRTIQARPVGQVERAFMWVKRNPTVATLWVAIVLVSAMGVAGVYWKWKDAELQAQQANHKAIEAQLAQRSAVEEKKRAEEQAALEELRRYRAELVAASSAMQLANPSMCRRSLDAAPAVHRDWEWFHFQQRLDTSRLTIQGNGGKHTWSTTVFPNNSIAALSDDDTLRCYDVLRGQETRSVTRAGVLSRGRFSPDARRVAFVPERPHDDKLVIRDLRGIEPDLRIGGFGTVVHCAIWSPDQSLVATGLATGELRVLETKTGREVARVAAHRGHIGNLAFSEDGTRLATAGSVDRAARVWDTRTWTSVATLVEGHTWNCDAVLFSPDGKLLVAAAWYPSNTMWLWDIEKKKMIREMKRHTNQVKWFGFNRDGTRFASTSLDQRVILWHGQTGEHIATMHKHTGWISHGAFSPDGRRLVTSSFDRTIRMWDAQDGRSLAMLFGHTEEVQTVGYTADGATIVSGSRDGTVKLWDAREAEADGRLKHSSFVYGVAFHPDNERVATASWDGSARIWNATTGQELQRLEADGPDTIFSHVAFHPGGKLLGTLSRDSALRLWDVDTGKLVHRWKLRAESWQDSRIAFTNDGKLLAASDGENHDIVLFDMATMREARRLRGAEARVRDLAFNNDGTRLAAAGEDVTNVIRVWDTTTGQLLHTLEGHTESICSVAFRKDGRMLATGSANGTILLWDATTWERSEPLHNGSAVHGLDFSPDGTRLAAACADNSVRFWSVQHRFEVAELRGHTDYVHSVAFSPNGERFISGSGDRTARVWDSLSRRERAERSKPTRP